MKLYDSDNGAEVQVLPAGEPTEAWLRSRSHVKAGTAQARCRDGYNGQCWVHGECAYGGVCFAREAMPLADHVVRLAREQGVDLGQLARELTERSQGRGR